MRHCYLKRRSGSSSGGSRGGVSSNNSGDYELEIGAEQYASTERVTIS